MSVFIPAIRRQMERDYEGVNVRFYLRQPTGIFSTVFFSPENRLPILGLAPLDFWERAQGRPWVCLCREFFT
jgi:hypothetical protein